MTVGGIDYVYLETRDWRAARAFWEALGWSVTLDLGTSGRLEPPGGGCGVFLQEASPEVPLSHGVYLRLDDQGFVPPKGVTAVGGPITSHWGSTLITVRDPDGREFVLQWSPPHDANDD